MLLPRSSKEDSSLRRFLTQLRRVDAEPGARPKTCFTGSITDESYDPIRPATGCTRGAAKNLRFGVDPTVQSPLPLLLHRLGGAGIGLSRTGASRDEYGGDYSAHWEPAE